MCAHPVARGHTQLPVGQIMWWRLALQGTYMGVSFFRNSGCIWTLDLPSVYLFLDLSGFICKMRTINFAMPISK